jgi:hypothetical protein
MSGLVESPNPHQAGHSLRLYLLTGARSRTSLRFRDNFTKETTDAVNDA